jgi:hypothetical protein
LLPDQIIKKDSDNDPSAISKAVETIPADTKPVSAVLPPQYYFHHPGKDAPISLFKNKMIKSCIIIQFEQNLMLSFL